MDALLRHARQLTAAPRGIVALDTAAPETAARFRAAGLVPTEPMVRAFRAVVLQAPALAAHASGVVLRPEDLDMPVGTTTAADLLRLSGVLIGVRVDTGHELAFGAADRVTSGLDGLAGRLTRFRDSGAQFAIWSVCTGLRPGDLASLTVNSQAAARFARTCQDLGVVPVVRVGGRMPAGPPANRRAALGAALLSVVGHIEDLEVDLTRVVLNTLCEVGPPDEPLRGSPLSVLPRHLGGVVLSEVGKAGPGDDEAVADTVGTAAAAVAPWPVTFYIGRDATIPALRAWGGQTVGTVAAQQVLADMLGHVADRLPLRPSGVAVLPGRGAGPQRSFE